MSDELEMVLVVGFADIARVKDAEAIHLEYETGTSKTEISRHPPLELGTVFTRFTNPFAFCPEFGGGRSWGYGTKCRGCSSDSSFTAAGEMRPEVFGVSSI